MSQTIEQRTTGVQGRGPDSVGESEARVVATVSHELRGSAAVVCGYLETLVRQGERLDPKARQEMTARALKAAWREAALIDQLLDHARLESGPFEFEPRAIGLRDELTRVLDENFVPEERERVDLATTDGLRVWADPNALDRILTNLISNALVHSPPDAPVGVEVQEAGGEVVVTVADHGPGIEPEERERIFRPFEGARSGGTGLGLAIVRRAVELLGGQVWVDSENGDGARFSFTLPAVTRSNRSHGTTSAA